MNAARDCTAQGRSRVGLAFVTERVVAGSAAGTRSRAGSALAQVPAVHPPRLSPTSAQWTDRWRRGVSVQIVSTAGPNEEVVRTPRARGPRFGTAVVRAVVLPVRGSSPCVLSAVPPWAVCIADASASLPSHCACSVLTSRSPFLI